MAIYVTQTQKLVAEAALSAVGAHNLAQNPETIDDIVRAMLVIEKGHMQAYMLRGFNWSYRSRNRRDPLNTFLDRHNLETAVEVFQSSIDSAGGEAARRIRGNRARRVREAERAAAEYNRVLEERREQRRLRRAEKLANQPIEQLIA
jgi:hypothetical protein